jgi:hypothetical protein
MKKLSILFIVLVISCSSFAIKEQLLLKNITFNNGLLHWQSPKAVKDTAFTTVRENNKNILKISGGKKEVCQLVQSVNISPEKLLNKRVNFFAIVKVEKLSSGSLNLMVREINSKSKTIRYRTVKITKWTSPNWQRYNISFEVRKPTCKLQIYIKSNYLTGNDCIYVKDLELKITDIKK